MKNKGFSQIQITEEDHLAVWNHLRGKHLDRYNLYRANSLEDSDNDLIHSGMMMMNKVKDLSDLRRGSLPSTLPSHYPQCEDDDLVNISIDLNNSMEFSKFAQPHPHALMNRKLGNDTLESSIDCFCSMDIQSSSSGLHQSEIVHDVGFKDNEAAVISPIPKSGLNKDIEIRDDSIILYGNLKEKKVEDSFTIVVSPYEEIVIEKVTGKGKLYCFDYSSKVEKKKKLLDSDDENFVVPVATSVEGMFEKDRKSFLANSSSESKGICVLQSGRTYFFKYVKTRTRFDSAILYYRNSYAL
ncbi:hypothetical protein C9374_002993 [Naegleria lovaniensis]|uniref:Uncharacterized protein n=1 Tax=Naegleria lovaniensis TaxID=51637 RepID=A0AA88GTH4_NAELO|nr:uncharacterized protein C9374_002993 [Naegleria lovaniensis]KAG2385844.1 hypothetical protein C9374_002993 [Naegleria lovaniensis]